MSDIMRIGEDNICPITREQCEDETCTPGAECNLSGEQPSPSTLLPEIGGEEVLKMSEELAAESDMAAIGHGQMSDRPEPFELSDISDAFEAGQNWMWKKIAPQLSSSTLRIEELGKELEIFRKSAGDMKQIVESDSVNWVLANALRLLTPEQMIYISDALYERSPHPQGRWSDRVKDLEVKLSASQQEAGQMENERNAYKLELLRINARLDAIWNMGGITSKSADWVIKQVCEIQKDAMLAITKFHKPSTNTDK